MLHQNGGIDHHDLVAYDLKGLGEKKFEDLCRAIAVHVLGNHVQAFGDGPDGGRELSWKGTVAYPGSDPRDRWTGYGVLQAKFRRQDVGLKDFDWLRSQLREELATWTDPSAARVKRGRMPQFLIVVTNVRLSSVAGTGGIDQTLALLAEHAKTLGMSGWAPWEANQISMYLDAYPAVAQRFSAFITPSDVLAETKNTLTAMKERQRGNPAARCPSCKSQQMSQRVPALYGEQRREVKTRVDGRPYRATSVSAVGLRIAPPAMPTIPVRLMVLAGFLGLCFLGSAQSFSEPTYAGADSDGALIAMTMSLMAGGLVTFAVIRIFRHRSRVEPEMRIAKRLWQHTWCCRRCGIAWVSAPDLPRELWGRPFQMNTMTANLRAIARNILVDHARRSGQGSTAPRPAER